MRAALRNPNLPNWAPASAGGELGAGLPPHTQE